MYEDSTKDLVSWMKVLFLTALIVLAGRQFLIQPLSVHGESMMPTFENDDKVILNKISRIENFDLIVFDAPDDHKLIKRVIGLPGDRLEMKADRLYINGELVEEPYLTHNRKVARQKGHSYLTEDFAEITVPAECYFVLGDNRLQSVDSRMFGFVPKEAVLGEVKFRFAPFEYLGAVE
ncbi:signal peptidase I [Planococcus salinus]|uniref:Signal peptidase I n=1 Tax=Planococcus salinus TaxID=1848460 RepID=A0A3M8P9I9_9BACL|nr:signal peptidase I [Planococcus salinus]RNF40313.1 signal peptidase I [Planococcus salinus]